MALHARGGEEVLDEGGERSAVCFALCVVRFQKRGQVLPQIEEGAQHPLGCGLGQRRIEQLGGRLAVVICYDADYPDLLRQAGRAGAALLLVPGFDWDPIRYRHPEMASFRAVENGVALVRPAGRGTSIATDAQGRVMSMVDDTPTDPSALTATIPTAGTSTLYPRIGDAFAWLCVGGLAVLAGWVVLRKWLRVDTWGEPGPQDVVPPWMRRKG